jgi:hypothetical protein
MSCLEIQSLKVPFVISQFQLARNPRVVFLGCVTQGSLNCQPGLLSSQDLIRLGFHVKFSYMETGLFFLSVKRLQFLTIWVSPRGSTCFPER